MNGWMDWMDRWMEGYIDKWTDGWMERQTDRHQIDR
jgi:hypothetical protein